MSGRRALLAFCWLVAACLLGACRAAPQTELHLEAPPRGLSPILPVPDDNPLTRQRIELGRMLFSDKALSRDGTLACISCHDPSRAFTDGRERAVGIDGRVGRRNAPSLLNVGYARSLFWDGRVESLEAQALRPMENPAELGNTHETIVRRLERGRRYRRLFARAFGSPDVTIERVAQAIASFERTLLSGNSAFDRHRLGDAAALGIDARRGLALFEGRARCAFCHEGRLLTDRRFHNTGVSWRTAAEESRRAVDPGRYAVTGRAGDRGAFRTPSLRDVALTAPYMHDGSFGTLTEVVDFYDRGGYENPYLDDSIRPLSLSAREKADLVAFLEALTGFEQDDHDMPRGHDVDRSSRLPGP